jgi:hypothetical protein
MKEKLNWINNNGNTFGKLETTNYVVNETFANKWKNEHVAQCAWITPLGKVFDNFNKLNTLEIPITLNETFNNYDQ